MLHADADAPLTAIVVWVPKSRGTQSAVEYATSFVGDPRAVHFWDARGRVMDAFEAALDLGEDAWDVFLLYDRGTRWDRDLPPAPAYWMHQLGSEESPRVEGPWLDPRELASRTRRLLEAARTAPVSGPAGAPGPAAPR